VRAVLVLLLLTGCASDRWLSKEEDAEMRKNCEPKGCACMPNDQWRAIEELLKRLGMTGI